MLHSLLTGVGRSPTHEADFVRQPVAAAQGAQDVPDRRQHDVVDDFSALDAGLVQRIGVACEGRALTQRRQPAAVVEPSTPVPTETSGALVVREDSRRLNDVPDATVTFVEFLDFECEACAAVFPAIEQLRQTYGDRVSFVIRYFPLPSHFNSERAARAVEAAAQQGELEAMYTKMYQTQTEWGEQQESKAPLFREFAQELGLDMDAYDAAVADPATQQRVERDRQDGLALGVQGTPTFFLDGEPVQVTSAEDFLAQIDAAVND